MPHSPMPAGRQGPQYPKVTIRDVLAEYWNAAKNYRLTIAITTVTTTRSWR